MSIKTWQERMGVDKWQNVAMQSEIDELRARYVELKQANSELATASIIPEGYQLVPIEPTKQMLQAAKETK